MPRIRTTQGIDRALGYSIGNMDGQFMPFDSAGNVIDVYLPSYFPGVLLGNLSSTIA
jgi:hypothetical protein